MEPGFGIVGIDFESAVEESDRVMNRDYLFFIHDPNTLPADTRSQARCPILPLCDRPQPGQIQNFWNQVLSLDGHQMYALANIFR